MNKVYKIIKPDAPLPLVFDFPHSGTIYPDDFGYACDFKDLVNTEDKYVNDLFENAPDFGGVLLMAKFPRCYIDVNRAHNDIDPNLLMKKWSDDTIAPSARSHAGIGLIRRLVHPGTPVYDRYLTEAEIRNRIDTYYTPYHKALQNLMDEAHYNYGQVWHINCHSMPASSAFPKKNLTLTGNRPVASDFVLGDRDGTSCDINFRKSLQSFISNLGYTVTINDPFKGVALIKQYSAPNQGKNSLQIEINKGLYMNEQTNQKNAKYGRLKNDIERIMMFCANYVRSNLTTIAAD